MVLRWSWGCMAALMCVTAVEAAEPGAGAADFARGNSLLQARDFSAAMDAFASAAKAEPDNEGYRQEHALLRRIVQMRADLGKQGDAKKWDAAAVALRSYYVDHGLLEEALLIDQEAHTRFANADSAARLADTQIKLGQDAAAAETLSGLAENQRSPQTQAQLGIALAHIGRTDEARKAAEGAAPADAGPGLLYDLARLHALVGDPGKSMELLTRCFESTRPSRLAAFKDYAKADKDLSSVVALSDFAKTLATESKIKESDCSGGTSCAKCPSRDKCAGTTNPKATAPGKK